MTEMVPFTEMAVTWGSPENRIDGEGVRMEGGGLILSKGPM